MATLKTPALRIIERAIVFKRLRGRFLAIGAVVLACLWSLRGFVTPDPDDRPIRLGLDLAGGSYLVLEVSDPEGTMPAEARVDAIDRALEIVRNRIDQFGVREPTVQKVGAERIVIELPEERDPERAKKVIQQTAFLEFKIVTDGRAFTQILPVLDSFVVASLPPEEKEAEPAARTLPAELLQKADTGAGRVETAAARELALAEERKRPLTALLLQGGEDGVFLVEEQDVEKVQRYLELPDVKRRVPAAIDLVWGAEPQGQAGRLFRPLYVLEPAPMITGEYLTDAQADRDLTYNRPVVRFQLTRQGGRIFERGTSQHVGDRMAVILDGKVQSSPPVIRSVIADQGQIELAPGAPMEEARDLALVLRAGALPAPLQIVEERTV
ncbi:MAG: hypothetical protein HY702_01040, partial [Gemmatimonadetes bacterium]|nr:hypothetical protein [Gemmatimonadota bacterium]